MSNNCWIFFRVVCASILVSSCSFAFAEEAVFFTSYDGINKEYKDPISVRTTKTKEERIEVVVDGCKYSTVKFDETERHSRISNDFSALLGNLKGRIAKMVVDGCGPMKHEYILKYDRAQLKLTAIDLSGKEASSMTIITGPAEHLYLGLDLPVNSKKTLKYDPGTKSLVPTDANPQLYLSINYYFGDLADPQQSTGKFSFKTFILATSRPLDSYGIGVGYQLPSIKAIDVDLSPINVFAGRFWYKEDAISNTGEAMVNQSTVKNWRFGITYDLGTALGWVK